MFQLPALMWTKIMGFFCVLMLIVAVFTGLYAWGASKEAEREIADRDAKLRANELVIRDLRQAITLQNHQIDSLIQEGRTHAARMTGEKRAVEVKLSASEREVARLKGLPLPEDFNLIRAETDPIVLDLAKGWK